MFLSAIIIIISLTSAQLHSANPMPVLDVGLDQSRRLKIKKEDLWEKKGKKHYHTQLEHCVWYECDAAFSKKTSKINLMETVSMQLEKKMDG